MPTYDYVCEACEHAFEEFQSMSEELLKKCPECGRLKLRRLFGTGAAVLFKGSGFYQTDYRSESYKAAAKADAPAGEAAPAKDTNGKGDTSSKGTGDASAKSGGKSPKSKG
jgi:putative FmdB family regulatory protein